MCLASPDEFDADDWLLNLENGVLNLRTFEFMPHNPNLKLTKSAPVTYDPNADCPKWKAFLQRIFNNNERLIRFVQRAVGYSLTGSTREQCLFFLYGTGANGKSTFLEVIRALLGDYAVTAEFSTFVADRKSSVRNDIARLHSARLVTAIEVGEGKRFAEELIKTLTGGDTVAARFLYREFFEFKPRFKVWLAANYKPEIRGTDYAIWRRIRLIPFTVTIPPEEQIPNLAEQLKEELSGILNWALEGLRDWLANGLQPPPEVTEATEAYRAEMDIVGLFVQDACVTDPKAVTPSKTLYEAFREWCAENGYEPFGQTAFGRRLAAKGFSHILTYVNGRRCRCWVGIRLRSDADPQPDLLSPDLTGDGTDGTDGTRFSESCPINSDADQSFGNSCSICSICSVPPQPDPFPPDQSCADCAVVPNFQDNPIETEKLPRNSQSSAQEHNSTTPALREPIPEPQNPETDLSQTVKYVDTEQSLEELCAELSEASNKPPDDTSLTSQQKPDRLACLCGGELRLFGKTYECLRCNSPRPAVCRNCGKALWFTPNGHAECIGCGVSYAFDLARRLWLADDDVF
jgi:putative DNA primase/helicase